MQAADINAIEAGHCERAAKSNDDDYRGRNGDCCGSTRVRIHSGNHSHVGIRLRKDPIREIPKFRRCLWVGCADFRTPGVGPGSGSEHRSWSDHLPQPQRLARRWQLTLEPIAGLGLGGRQNRPGTDGGVGVANMITVFGEGRGFRVVWLLEEMGIAYRLRPVDLLAGVEKDPEFLAINPAGFIPAMVDRRRDDGRVHRDHGIPDGALRADAARPRSARSRFPCLSTVPSPGRSRPRGFHLLRRRCPQLRAARRNGKTGAPARRSVCSTAGWDW